MQAAAKNIAKNTKKSIASAKNEDKVVKMEDKVSIMQKAISVSELNATIHACMDSPIFQGLEVFGEVSG